MHANGNAFRTNLSAPDLTEADKYLSRGTWTFPLSQWLFKTSPLSILQTGPVIFINWMLLTRRFHPFSSLLRPCSIIGHDFGYLLSLKDLYLIFVPFFFLRIRGSFMIPHFVHAIRDIYSPPLCYTIIFALKFFLKILPYLEYSKSRVEVTDE